MAEKVDVAALRRLIKVGGYARATVGVALLLLPGLVGPMFTGRDAVGPVVRMFVRMLGIRDLVIGAGAIVAANEGNQLRRWVEFGMVADGVDAAATVLAARHLPKGRAALVTAVAGGSAAAGAWTLSQLPDEVPSTA